MAHIANGKDEVIAREGYGMKFIFKSLLIFVGMMSASIAQAGGGSYPIPLEKAKISVLDQASLQRGADLYAQYCMGCHSLKYLRVNRAARDLGWSPEEGVAHFQHIRNGQGKPTDMIETTLNPETAKQAFGIVPPDLSLQARLRGTDWIYTFLRSYERADDGTLSNKLFPGVAMPHILEGLQASLPAAEFDAAVGDLVNFMDYAAEPAKPQRLMMGWWVLGFLALLIVLTYLLKKEFWRDVK
jgi:ubiquinol-cytochrome c reductase cytochrome c1 subunit